jgi:hypothetical protein
LITVHLKSIGEVAGKQRRQEQNSEKQTGASFLQFRGVLSRFRVSGVVPDDLIPELAVFVEYTRLGIDEAVRVDVINDVVTSDLEVKLFGVHRRLISRNDLASETDVKVRL